ncbi:MAG: fumarylacetoacetate hydrolase family protein [Chloroflexota bacterium]|nr:fumarylacetoacetate hydrolase family protein [Chloroflexota bacterium]
MKIVRYGTDGGADYGILENETVYAATGDLFDGLGRGDEVGALASLTLLTPIQPGKIVCVGLNYAAHVTENDASRTVPEEPVLFMKPNSTLIAPGDPITIANPENRTDYEAELVIVIGKRARRISESDAVAYIFGFTAGNDVSDRVLQAKDGQWIRAKGFDTYCPLGPCIETELDVRDAKVESRLNGEVRQSQTTANMIFNPHFLVSYISNVMTLDPGDIIMTGTPEGVGPLKSGDTIDVEVGGIGVLRNPVTNR